MNLHSEKAKKSTGCAVYNSATKYYYATEMDYEAVDPA
jgi:hypothetical protein